MKRLDVETVCLAVLLGISLAIALSGCSTVRPLAEISHTSHVSQHFNGNGTNCNGSMCGWNVISLGIRWRPIRGLQVDVLEGYSPETLDGKHEVFQGRVQYEW